MEEVTKEALKRLLEAPINVKLWNGNFNIATATANFARHRFELSVEVTHPSLKQWRGKVKDEVTLTCWQSHTGHPIVIPDGLTEKIAAMKSAATMSDFEAMRINNEFIVMVNQTEEALGFRESYARQGC